MRRNPRLVFLLVPVGAAALWAYAPRLLALRHAGHAIAAMFPPYLPPDAIAHLPWLFGETLLIAAGGTALGAVLALPLALAAARNLAPGPVVALVRGILEALRAVPEVVWGLVMVSLLSVGPAVGVMALGLHSAGVLGKLYAESFENVRAEPVRAIEATGATRLGVAFFAILPLAFAPMTIHSLFRFEWNLRAATVVGMIGAGGIGGALYEAQQLFFYPQMITYIVITWLIVSGSDLLGEKTRRRAECAYVPA